MFGESHRQSGEWELNLLSGNVIEGRRLASLSCFFLRLITQLVTAPNTMVGLLLPGHRRNGMHNT
ncbi:Uncharacterised protein [Yersinia aleksiciae]|uniref:Uncharacterized protein n=1 Tax=Yersinia aleksiciae TaxID=263819 RepID=A0A0T9U8I8_YERAE|nr:Uncharacterised protein [Yersinia aleksiciae]CNL26012.1 Uncharacterised protein [Yersinia aleksiciae]